MQLRTLFTFAATTAFLACGGQPDGPAVTPEPIERSAVTALGRLEPGLGVIDIGAPLGERVRRLQVAEGETITKGTILAVLESFDERQTEVDMRRAQAEEARNRLQRSREVGPLAVAAREATTRRLEADLDLATSDLRRTRELVTEEVVPERDLEFQEAVEAQARAALDEARTVLEREQRERRLAIAEAAAALATAEAAQARAEASLAQSEIRAPVDGEVLDLLVLEGESTDNSAILRLGEIRRMVAVAEVYETDVRFVREGQRAIITSPALAGDLRGTVSQISDLVHKNDVLGIDPGADTDSRVIEARILLDQPELAARFVHLQVDVTIEISDHDSGIDQGS